MQRLIPPAFLNAKRTPAAPPTPRPEVASQDLRRPRGAMLLTSIVGRTLPKKEGS